MAGPQGILDVTYVAEVAMTSSQFCAVVVGTDADEMALPSGANAGKFLGILQDAPAINAQGRVRKLGLSWAMASERVGRGNALEIANSSGHLRSAQYVVGSYCGTAEEAATEGDRFLMFVLPIELTGSDVTFSSSSSSSSSST